MSSSQKDIIKESLGKLAKNTPDLSSLFVWKASQSLLKGGVLASIIPASFLDSNSSEPIRQQLLEILETKLVARLGSHLLFSSALIDAGLYVGSKAHNPEPSLAFWADHRIRSNAEGLRTLRKIRYSNRNVLPVIEDGYNIYQIPKHTQDIKSWSPRPFEAYSLLSDLVSRNFSTIDFLFDVKQGIRTGDNKVFLLSANEFEALPKKEQKYFRLAVVNKSIKYGYLIDSTYVFYPYGKNEIDSEDKLSQFVPNYYENVLLKNRTKLSKRAGINSDKWWYLTRHREWQVERNPKLISTYFGDAGSFAWDESGDFVVVQGFGWILRPKKSIKEISQSMGLSYLAVLNSKLFGELLAAVSNHVGGGQWNLSKKFVKDIPLPDLTKKDFNPELIDELAFFGKQIHAGKFSDDIALEKLVRTIYQVDR